MRTIQALFVAAFTLVPVLAGCERSATEQPASGSPEPRRAASQPPPSDRLLPPADLARTLADPNAKKPIILFVGPEQLFAKHVPGARDAGEGGTPEGLARLRSLAQTLPRDAEVVLYCGCCPPRNCPNIKPAYAALVDLGFSSVRVLDLQTTFRADWRDKGYPVESR
jgi:hypothetical protein